MKRFPNESDEAFAVRKARCSGDYHNRPFQRETVGRVKKTTTATPEEVERIKAQQQVRTVAAIPGGPAFGDAEAPLSISEVPSEQTEADLAFIDEVLVDEDQDQLVAPFAKYPAEAGEGKLEAFACQEPGGCGAYGDAWVQRKIPAAESHTAMCPLCSRLMTIDWSRRNLTINARGPGAHDGTIGDRKKRMMKERSDSLNKTQWENHEPIRLAEGATPRNPTAGGVYDPNGPFVKKKRPSKVMLPSKPSTDSGGSADGATPKQG